MRSGRLVTAAGITAALLTAPAALGAAPDDPAASVDANGNPVTGGLNFMPKDVTVAVGQAVRWTNTDFFAPHTATEDHGLWDLAGSYGISALGPLGFGPGESVQRPFEAGTHAYYCRVHGKQAQSGTVSVPVSLRMTSQRRRGRTRYVIVATWSPRGPQRGELFDVEVKRGEGPWKPFMNGTTARDVRIPGGRKGTVTHVRARLRKADDAALATGWSPDAAVVSG